MSDTAEQVGTIEECLYSLGNRVEIAKVLSQGGKCDLLITILEDIFTSAQMIIDEYCVKKDA